MKTIYLIRYDNGQEYEDNQEFVYQYGYKTKERALEEIEKLTNNQEFLEDACAWNNIEDVKIWLDYVKIVD